MTGAANSAKRRWAVALFWIWIVAVLALYVASFGPVLRLLAGFFWR